MPTENSNSENWSTTWIAGLREGDGIAAQRLWDRYFKRLVVLARHKMQGAKRSVRDEEDVALSAFNSFCHGLRVGKFEDQLGAANLWTLLVAITLHKATDQIRRDNRKKRGGTGGSEEASKQPFSLVSLDELQSMEPAPDLNVAATETFERLIELLEQTGDSDLSSIALGTFEGDTPNEIAQRLDCSLRTVQRKLKTIRALWEQHLS